MITQNHDYTQVDIDGTVECNKCGLRNSDASRSEDIPCEFYPIDATNNSEFYDEFGNYFGDA